MSYNLIAADQHGIAYRVGLDVPHREGDLSGDRAPWKSMNGRDATTLWDDQWLERAQIPRSRAPTRGWLGTANTDPWGFTGDGRIDNDPWYYGTFFQAGYRGQRIEDEITRRIGLGDLTLEDMKEMQRDIHSIMADDVVELLATAHGNIGTDPDLDEFANNPDLDRVVQLLCVEWDQEMALDSPGALAWQPFMHFFAETVAADDIPLAYDFAMELMTVFVVKVTVMALKGEYPNGDAFLQEGRDWILLDSARRTADWLIDKYGSTDPSVGYKYEDFVRLSFDDAFGLGVPVFSLPKEGGEDTLNVNTNMSFDPDADEWVTHYVSVERTVGQFDDNGNPEVFVNFPVGNHADPDSADTQAAVDDYMNVVYKKFLFDRSEIEANLRETIEVYR
jgi:penicillin amidase